MNRFDKIISLYKATYKKEPDSCIEFVKKQKTLADAIKIAALSINEKGVKHGHQNRIPKVILEQWYDAILIYLYKLKTANNFDEIISILQNAKISGIGELTIYDSANRIGAYMNFFPEKIYLHAGTREGARKILGNTSGKYTLKSNLPKEFQRKDLSCWEIEDILCIFKDSFDRHISECEFNRTCLKGNQRTLLSYTTPSPQWPLNLKQSLKSSAVKDYIL